MRTDEIIKDPQAYSDMDYLCSEAAQSRTVIAAHFVKDCPHVFEIGGFKTPISMFLTGRHDSVTVMDPLMREYEGHTLNGQPCSVRHIAQPFQTAGVSLPGDYGFVMLGASLKYFSDIPEQHDREWQMLADMLTGARVAVVEAAVDWPLGIGILDRLLDTPGVRVRASIDLDLSANPGMDPDHYRRRLVVLDPAKPGAGSSGL